jgi:hypothetical protein
VFGSGREKDVESPISNPPGLVIDQICRCAADFVGTPDEFEEHSQPHALGGFAHTRRNVGDAQCIRGRSVEVG